MVTNTATFIVTNTATLMVTNTSPLIEDSYKHLPIPTSSYKFFQMMIISYKILEALANPKMFDKFLQNHNSYYTPDTLPKIPAYYFKFLSFLNNSYNIF